MSTTPLQVAFFRNLNLGQRGSPTRVELLDALRRAGAVEPWSFRSNGTVVFDAPAPDQVIADATHVLTESCGWHDVAPVRPLDWLHAAVAGAQDVGEHTELSFFDLDDRTAGGFPVPLPWRPARGRCTVVAADHLHAVVVNDAPRTSYATRELEPLLGVPVTSRGLSTLAALCARARGVQVPQKVRYDAANPSGAGEA